MPYHHRTTLLLGALALTTLLAWPVTGATQSNEPLDDASAVAAATLPASTLADRFAGLAGSTANAQSLVQALRSGTPITLADGTGAGTTVSNPSRPLGYGEIAIALGLAQQSLAAQGITSPTPTQLQAALVGGLVTLDGRTVNMTGVLAQRAAGMGWGQIANAMGTRLGAVVSALHTQRPAEPPGLAARRDDRAPATRAPSHAGAPAGSPGADGRGDGRDGGHAGGGRGHGGGGGNGGGSGGGRGR